METIEKLFNGFSVFFGIAGGFLAYILGGWDSLLITIITLVILDYLTGIIKGIYLKELSSEIGFKGILKKVMIFIVIAFSFTIQKVTNDTIPLREIVIMFFIANEGISILENAAVLIPIPEKLKEILLQLRDKTENKDETEESEVK